MTQRNLMTSKLRQLRCLTAGLAIAILVVTAGGALTISGMRRSIGRSAEASAALERSIREQSRENENRASQIARMRNPQYLLTQVPPGLREVEEEQLIYLSLEPPPPEPVPHSAEAYAETASPRSITFELPILGATAVGSTRHP